jgi:hypothetical protein
VLTDLAAILFGSTPLYSDVLNEFLAVDVVPQLMTADEHHAQWRPEGPRTRLTVRVEYREVLAPDGAPAAHFQDEGPTIPAWDAVALASVARNRHSVAAVRALLNQMAQPGPDTPVPSRLRRSPGQ